MPDMGQFVTRPNAKHNRNPYNIQLYPGTSSCIEYYQVISRHIKYVQVDPVKSM